MILLLYFSVNNNFAQNILKIENLKSNFVKKENKTLFYKNFIDNIKISLSLPLEKNFQKWDSALKDAESILYDDPVVIESIKIILNHQTDKKIKLQRTALEAASTFYRSEFSKPINEIFVKTDDKISYAISVNFLIKINYQERSNEFYLMDLKSKFKDYESDPLLMSLKFDLENSGLNKFTTIPPIEDLFYHSFQTGKTIIFSIQRKNRKFPGITLVKKPDGSFVSNEDGSLFHIPQLALSYSNLPSYLSNANTPEGIYSIIGTYISPTETIGPTPNILVRSPFEVEPTIFYHGANNYNSWNLSDYKNLLPKSWQSYFPIYQSFYSGKIGRKLIIIHGSTDETKFFENQSYYPLTPTRGCLSSKELWSEENGKCLESDQVKLINAFNETRQKKGFLVVFEIDDKQEPITLEEILPYIKRGPQR